MNGTTMPGAAAPGVVVSTDAAESIWRRGWSRFFRNHPHWFDAALAIVIYLMTASAMIVGDRMGNDPTPPAWAWIVSGIACAALLFRRIHPWPVLAVTVVGFLLVQSASQDVPPLILTVVTALVTITLAGQRWPAIIAAVAVTLATMLIGTITDATYWSHPRPIAVASLCALSIAFADAIRNRRAYVAAVEERARRAEESREQEASRRVGDERLRIARELHDVLAHHIAVINVQAGVAGHLLERQPDQAREALDHVRAAARSVLSEMQAVVTVLREPGDSTAEPSEPLPGMDGIDDLVDGFRALGLQIDTVVSGAPAPLPAAVDLVAYRAVQESLTNVGKHAGNAPVVVEFDYRPEAFAVTVTNRPARAGTRTSGRQPNPTGGFGLIGMRERAGSVGGQLRAQPTSDGGFVTSVTLPLSR